MHYQIKIYGDNILECERALDVIYKGICISEKVIEKKFIKGNLLVPCFQIIAEKNYEITLFPGLQNERWNINIYEELVYKNGGTLSEGADALITIEKKIDGNICEIPCLAIEFSSALPAGNNSWQRSGRALSFSQASIPYVYSTEIGGNELDSSGNIIATRWPSSSLILSYILNSTRQNIINLIYYELSPVSTKDLRKKYSILENDNSLSNLAYNLINEKPIIKNQEAILSMDSIIYNNIAKNKENYFEINGSFNNQHLISGIKKQKLQWNKIVSIKTSASFTKLRALLSKYCFSPYSVASLPFTLLPRENIDLFFSELELIYPKNKFMDLKNSIKSDVVFSLINGFKPRGDDSRPDRGVTPFVNMLFGFDIPVVTVIFGPIPTYHLLELKKKDYQSLAKKNGLFSSIFKGSDFIIVDTLDNGNNQSLFLKNDLKTSSSALHSKNNMYKKMIELPSKIGEQDVDTLIHMMFKHGMENIFESFSNPPGGDWSGVSILKDGYEYRWISLPRAPKNVKRPDHIFQINENTLLSIESKDTYSVLINKEKNVGKKMIDYLDKLLFPRPFNAFRKIGESIFEHFNETKDLSHFTHLTSATFISKNDKDITFENLDRLLNETSTDMVFGMKVCSISDIQIYFLSKNTELTELLTSSNSTINDFGVVKIIDVAN